MSKDDLAAPVTTGKRQKPTLWHFVDYPNLKDKPMYLAADVDTLLAEMEAEKAELYSKYLEAQEGYQLTFVELGHYEELMGKPELAGMLERCEEWQVQVANLEAELERRNRIADAQSRGRIARREGYANFPTLNGLSGECAEAWSLGWVRENNELAGVIAEEEVADLRQSLAATREEVAEMAKVIFNEITVTSNAPNDGWRRLNLHTNDVILNCLVKAGFVEKHPSNDLLWYRWKDKEALCATVLTS
jgi:hypothetical protein